MIIFHEGLPRSGKSYEAMVKHVLEALKKGRHVFAHVDGLNVERIAECAQLPVGAVSALIHPLDVEQLKEIWKHVKKDSLVVIDEAQDHWPSQRQPLGKELTTFVTQHGHEGLDILLMGQDHRDVHTLWRRRIQNLITFLKLDAVGMEQKYKVTVHRYNGRKFIPISTSIEEYKKEFFGMYKSHTDGTSNTGNYKDKRAVVWNKWTLRYGLPAAFLVGAYAIYYLFGFFHSPEAMSNGKLKSTNSAAHANVGAGRPVSSSSAAAESFEARRARREAEKLAAEKKAIEAEAAADRLLDEETKYLLDIQRQGRLRLAGVLHNNDKGTVTGIVEVLDPTFHRKESFRFGDLEAMGWVVQVVEYGLKLSRQNKTLLVRPWPIDPVGYVPAERVANGDFKSKTTVTSIEPDPAPSNRRAL